MITIKNESTMVVDIRKAMEGGTVLSSAYNVANKMIVDRATKLDDLINASVRVKFVNIDNCSESSKLMNEIEAMVNNVTAYETADILAVAVGQYGDKFTEREIASVLPECYMTSKKTSDLFAMIDEKLTNIK